MIFRIAGWASDSATRYPEFDLNVGLRRYVHLTGSPLVKFYVRMAGQSQWLSSPRRIPAVLVVFFMTRNRVEVMLSSRQTSSAVSLST
jgi:hypothetical protein